MSPASPAIMHSDYWRTALRSPAATAAHSYSNMPSNSPSVRIFDYMIWSALDFADDASFDSSLCSLAINNITNQGQLLSELHRVIRPGGWLLISTSHPTSDWHRFGGSYYDQDWVDLRLAKSRFSIKYQRMPLGAFLSELLSAGFTLEQLVEPRPDPQLRDIDPRAYAKLSEAPCFLAVRLRRRPRDRLFTRLASSAEAR